MIEKRAEFRFYEELNDFLPPARRKVSFLISFQGTPAVKDLIESLGVPHAEIDLVLINGESAPLGRQVRDGDRVAVYPVFECFNIARETRVRSRPLRVSRFILDVNLGKCARLLRLLGFDSLYSNTSDDRNIVTIALAENRTILTRDVGLLKIKEVTHGLWIRATSPPAQVREVITRCDLFENVEPFSRCLECNAVLESVDKQDVLKQIPPRTRRYYHEFRRCQGCHKIYWPGSHYTRMKKLVDSLLAD